jgi:hypothetical protein
MMSATAQHVRQVRGAVLFRRRADRDELEQPVRDALLGAGRESQAAFLVVATDDLVEPWLVDWDLAALQALDLARVDVHADHVVADFSEAGARDEPDVT